MRLTILGSGSFLPDKNRNCSGYLLDIGGETILLDGGSGTLRQIAKADRSILEIRRVFYTHFHLDHMADFAPLLFTRKYFKPERPTAPLYIHAHRDFAYYFDSLTKIFEKWTVDPEFPALFQPLTPGEFEFPGYKLRVFPSNHTPESLMYRFEEPGGKSMLYTGDVDLDDVLIEASQAVDLLLIECGNLTDNPAPGHMNPGKIGDLIRVANPKRIVLTHLLPEMDNLNIRQSFTIEFIGRIILAEDLRVFQLP
ncbi:MAG: ribonuclease Z [Candidatus Neomarinimicrobiota bacterium]